MKIEHVLLAEGVAADIRGALTIVGFNQRVINTPSLPFNFRQTLVVTLTDEAEGDQQAQSAQISVSLTSPEGTAAFAFTQMVQIPVKPGKGVPVLTNIAIDVPFSGVSYGNYKVKVSWQQAGEANEERVIDVFVVNPADLGN
ncbi:DUF6941 family protein [Streptomyces erythrochromogenes]|uniref:DUF6941 family protein n=1 Tax=Streptomyces erythrochromogenes TaxID=285574 RepID=UPI00386FD5A5|nr:hypothetical protein OG364_27080 [Streptomyces erythrochromogenes]